MGKESKENQTTCFITGPIKKCTFWKTLFLQLIQKCQKQLPIRGDTTSTCPSGLFKCPFVKWKHPFTEAKSPFPRTI